MPFPGFRRKKDTNKPPEKEAEEPDLAELIRITQEKQSEERDAGVPAGDEGEKAAESEDHEENTPVEPEKETEKPDLADLIKRIQEKQREESGAVGPAVDEKGERADYGGHENNTPRGPEEEGTTPEHTAEIPFDEEVPEPVPDTEPPVEIPSDEEYVEPVPDTEPPAEIPSDEEYVEPVPDTEPRAGIQPDEAPPEEEVPDTIREIPPGPPEDEPIEEELEPPAEPPHRPPVSDREEDDTPPPFETSLGTHGLSKKSRTGFLKDNVSEKCEDGQESKKDKKARKATKKKEEKKKAKEKKGPFSSLKKGAGEFKTYDFATDGPLVEPELPDGYAEVDRYWVKDGMSIIVIAQNLDTKLNEYLLFEPKLSRFERELAERLYEDMRDVLILTDEEILTDRRQVLIEKMQALIREYNVKIEDTALFKLQYYLFRNFLGWSRLDPLILDPNIEDISCDGSEIPIFLYHREYRNIKTNVRFDEETLYSLAIILAQRSGKHISVSQPMLDATLPDGSRLQLTLGKEITSRGTSFTIRKFREVPFTPIELIDYGTFNVDELVYFWLAIENNKSLLFVGGTASGKTTSLNAVSLFIPPLSKIVSIEDTREITLYHDNWIASVTRESTTENTSTKIDMFDLLKAAMRQRPEYILVGEVRGSEAQTLFQAMNTGHTTFSTLHANSVDAAIHRLENAPLNVPRNMVQALDIVSVQALIYIGKERIRRAMEIVEIAGIDPGTGNLRVNTVFEYDTVKDSHSYTGRSQVYTKIMEIRGWSKEEMAEEIERRRNVIQAMHDQGIIDYISVSKIFQAYSINSDKVMGDLDDLKKAYI